MFLGRLLPPFSDSSCKIAMDYIRSFSGQFGTKSESIFLKISSFLAEKANLKKNL